VPAWEASGGDGTALRCAGRSQQNDEYDSLLLIPVFILDFLCIHPFNDGNGRMSRLLTLLLLYRSGYIVGKYISIEKLIELSRETYYETLQQSSVGWYEEKNDYMPFVRYMLGVIVAAYREFSSRVQHLTASAFPRRIAFGRSSKRRLVKSQKRKSCKNARTLARSPSSGR